MYRNLAAAMAVAVFLGMPAGAAQNPANVQNVTQDAMAVIRAVDAAIGASKTRSIRYSGVDGYITAIGQSETSSVQHSWPRFNLKSFTRTIDYDTMSMREEQVRTQGAWPAERGGGLRPIVGERRSIA